MKKMCLFLLALIAGVGLVNAQDHSAADETVATFKRMYNGKQPDSVFYLLSDDVKQKMPIDKTKGMMEQVHAQMGELKSAVYLKKSGDILFYRTRFEKTTLQLAVVLDNAGKLSTFRFLPDTNEEKKEEEAGASEITATNGKATLHGTLTVPAEATKVPVVLLIAGSGPTDRNCNNGQGLRTDAYKQLADSLRRHGIACLRYDKRGIGASTSTQTETEMRFGDMVDDAIVLLNMLKNDSRFSTIYIVGHSEGSLVGMLAAQKVVVNGYISIAGIADPANKVIAGQLKAFPEESRNQALVIMDSIRKGLFVKYVPNDLQVLFRPSVQPYMTSWFKLYPAQEITRVKVPVLIIQGKKDMQVEEDQAIKLSKAKPTAKLVLLDNMTHTLKDAISGDESGQATYIEPGYPLTPAFVKALITFIK